MTKGYIAVFLLLWVASCAPSYLHAQLTTASLEGQVLDSSGAAIPKTTVTAVNTSTGLSRTVLTSESGSFQLLLLPVGEYTVTAEAAGFKRQAQKVTLQLGQVARLDVTLSVGTASEQVTVSAEDVGVEPTQAAITSVVSENAIANLPVNGREFIDFSLLAPGVTVGNTTSGEKDVIIEPTPVLSFAGQNLHGNFIAIDGADNISTASGIQRSTPSQEAVREFRVVNNSFSSEFGRAEGGIVNIITKSGTNQLHSSVYEFFRNDALDAKSRLQSPGKTKLRQNQFGGTIGGPIIKDRTFFFANYEGQRRREDPFYNSAVLNNIGAINTALVTKYNLPPENLNALRSNDYDKFLVKADHSFTNNHLFSIRYMFNDQRLRNISAADDGSDLPSAFRDNFLRDQSLAGQLTSTLSLRIVNDLRAQYAHRAFDFPVNSTKPELQFVNTFTSGPKDGNPDFYQESRGEVNDSVAVLKNGHTLQFGGNVNFVRTTESFPLFYPFTALFPSLDAFLGTGPFAALGPTPAIIFFQKFGDFTATSLSTSLYSGTRFPAAIRRQATGAVNHTYDGLFLQDKWRATTGLTLTFGGRVDFETWPTHVLENRHTFDPRFGFAYNLSPHLSRKRPVVLRGGFGVFHGIVMSQLLMSSFAIGGREAYPGRENIENGLNGSTLIQGFVSAPPLLALALDNLVKTGAYPTSATGLVGEVAVARFDRDLKNPVSLQRSLSVQVGLTPTTSVTVTYLGLHAYHLGSFYNVNAPTTPTGVLANGLPDYAAVRFDRFNAIPGLANPNFLLYLEAAPRWNSSYDGLLVNLDRRLTGHFGIGISYTWSKTLDDGPNPSFALVPQDNNHLNLERALSADDVRHRFVTNATVIGPTGSNVLIRNFQLGLITTLQSPHHFTRLAGFDANGDGFPNNDRVGGQGRNTFAGDAFYSVDARISRTGHVGERMTWQAIVEGFNLFNRPNIKFFNTVYGDSIVNPLGTPGTFIDGARNPSYGTPRAVFNPRQIQIALRLSF